jgi:8-amino-7-oxononanoate synthase
VESLYSMDGDFAPLDEICALCEEVGAFLVVDEAHATGIYGPQGAGLVQDTGLQSRVFARVHTFGKALGYKGACVVGPARLREALINFSRPFIYSTAPDLLSLRLMRLAYDTARAADEARQSLRERISDFRELRARVPELSCLPSESAIQAIIIPGNELVVAAERLLSEAGYAVRAIRSPTVPRGSERLRICLHAYNTRRDLEGLFATLGEAVPRRAHGQ